MNITNFTTREDIENFIISNLQKKRSFAIYALKYMGKTYLLNQIYKEIKEKKDTIYIDMSYIFNLEDFYNIFKINIKRIFKNKFDDVFDDDLKKIEFIFNLLGKKAENENRDIYIFIDNFEKIEDIQNSKLDLNYIFNNSFINFQNLIFCVTINNSFGIDTFKDFKSPLYSFCEVLDLPNLSEKEISIYLYKELKELEITQDLVFYIMKKTNNIIYYIDKICSILKHKNKITKEDIDKILNEIYKNYLIELYNIKLNSIRGKKYLSDVLYLIATNKNPYDELLIKVGNRGNISKMIKTLEKENLICKIKEPKVKYIIYDPFFKKYVLENFAR